MIRPMAPRALSLLLLLAAATPSAAAPVLHVRARTRLELTTVERTPTGVLVFGRLMDEALGEPIAGRVVAIAVEGPPGTYAPDYYMEARPTGSDGSFEWRIPLRIGRYNLKLQAGGDDDYAAAPPIVRAIDIARRTPTLRLEAPAEASVAARHVTISVEASDPEGELGNSVGASLTPSTHPAELPITVLVDGEKAAELRTEGGRAELELEVAGLGRPGARATVQARFDGDAERNPALATRVVRVTTPTTLTLRAAASELAWDGKLAVSGTLRDASGPIASAAVSLVLEGAHDDGAPVAAALTDGAGRFHGEIPGGSAKPGIRFLEARFHPNQSFREPSRSAALPITLLPPQPTSLVFIASPLLVLFALGLFALWRRRPWRTLAHRRRARQAALARGAASGLSEGRPRLLSTLRAPADHGLSGQACELPSGAPLPTATVVFTASGASRALAVDEEGRFSIEGLPAGPLLVEVSAPGFVTERFTRVLPHRGELRGARVLLVPLRARIFDAYLGLAVRLLPRPSLAETFTPRELLAHMERRSLLVEELAELTALVEVACFGPRLPEAALLSRAEALAARIAESARAAGLQPSPKPARALDRRPRASL